MATHHHHHHPRLAPGPQSKHSDAQSGDRLASILNHPLVQDPPHQAAHALLELRQEHYAADDVKRLMSAAFSDETTPPEVRAKIADFLINEFWQSPAGAEGHDQELYNDAADAGLGGLHTSIKLLLDLGWSPAEITEQEMSICGAVLDPSMIEQIERTRALRMEREAADEEDDQPEVQDIRDWVLAEYANGTLSPEREAAIKSVFGEDFFTRRIAMTEPQDAAHHCF
jgi:hypothetical protein